MQCVTNKMAQGLVNALLSISEILTKAVDQSVSLIPIVQLIKLALDLNVRILVQDSVDITLFVKLLIIPHCVLVSLDTLETRSFNVTLFKLHVSFFLVR